MKKRIFAFVLFLQCITCSVFAESLACYVPSGTNNTIFIARPNTGEYLLKLQDIKKIKNRDDCSVYFNKKNILIFESPEQKSRIVKYWKSKYKPKQAVKLPNFLDIWWDAKTVVDCLRGK